MAHEFGIELEQVSKQFDAITVVDNVSLAIQQGEFFSLLGSSGCGKTTTLRMIAGFEHPTQGTIKLNGEAIQDRPPHKRNVNMVFQNYALFPHMSVFDNVAFGLQIKRVPAVQIRPRVQRALEMVRLPGMERRKPAQLSGGQQQRVALARALINEPAILLLDEPLGALDQKLRKEMQYELKQLQREVGITFIYVTHDQEEALTMSDRIAVMEKGRVLQVDAPRAIYDSPATRFVADFIGTTNMLTARVKEHKKGEATLEIDGQGTFRVPCEFSLTAGQAVTLAVRPERLALFKAGGKSGADGIRGTLEDSVFVGNDTQHLVRLTSGERLIIREQNRGEGAQALSAGDSVIARWEAASARILVE